MNGYKIMSIIMLSGESSLPLFIRVYNDIPKRGDTLLREPLVLSGLHQAFSSYARLLGNNHILETGKELREIWFDDNILLVVRGTLYNTICSAKILDHNALTSLRYRVKRINDSFTEKYKHFADQVRREIEVFQGFESVCDGLVLKPEPLNDLAF